MIASLVGLLLVAIGLLVSVWATFYGALVLIGSPSPVSIAVGITAMIVVAIGYLEYRHLETIERLSDARPIDRETAPELYQTATRVAARLDVPPPTIAVSERDAPEALAVGFRPTNIHLVLSHGTIETLDHSDELEAVIAHELAHVKNRDAMVMTIVSLPVVLAAGLRSRIARIDHPGIVTAVFLLFLTNAVWVVGRLLTAHLSRARERAADRAAAAVTGSPAALASALSRLDQEIAETPERDLRDASAVSSLSILPLEPADPETVMLGPEGDTEPSYWWLRKRLRRLERRFFGTHPPTSDRIESLSRLEREP
ncbi:M48 family metalloprotease [Haloterrigena sp. SYSU A558-1]|uniref:M48 family metalloprotease n=2 Tax=Haloterrigena gelatinilytica TaxID=2741724 RepID=A0ABX2LKF1_9EURY|nr:M48 family metalloprotease [Haloterrigena gelatinilytica]NUC74132.1 M48 family metalloprotease [Haloterrigena gelatinilytica]